MNTRGRLFLFAHMGMAVICAAAANTLMAHHDPASAYHETYEVEHLMELAYRTCFGHGDDLAGLQHEAKAHGWKALADSELKRHASRVSEMIGGWVFTNKFGSFAIMQSKFKEGPSAYLCSVTAKLPFDRHDQVKSSFERRFAATVVRETDQSGKHIDRCLVTGPRKLPIDSSIVYVLSKGGITIHMTHGREGRQSSSGKGRRTAWSSSRD